MTEATLVYLIDGERVCLGYKTSGFGAGKWNGFGGKLEVGETHQETAIRELQEETGVSVSPHDLDYVAELYFHNGAGEAGDMHVHAYLAGRWDGEPREVEKMRPHWFGFGEVPYAAMWPSDPHWFPRVLQGERVRCTVWFDAKGERVEGYEIEDLK